MPAETSRPLRVSGRTAAEILGDPRTLSRRLGAEGRAQAGPHTPEADAERAELSIAGICVRLARGLMNGDDTGYDRGRIASAAAGLARDGVPAEVVHRAVHRGIRLCSDVLLTYAAAQGADDAGRIGRSLLDVLDTITAIVAAAYIDEYRHVIGHHTAATRSLTSVLLTAGAVAPLDVSGLAVAEHYHVLALAPGSHPDESHSETAATDSAPRRLRDALALRFGPEVLSSLGTGGGTLLVPCTRVPDDRLDELIGYLAAAARIPIHATTVPSAAPDVPAAARHAHQLLQLVQRLRYRAGLYRFPDIALEFQLTRPGPALDHLGRLLDPLDSQPELLETLRLHIDTDGNRKRMARTLNVHVNTVDYRLKRVGALTGFDPVAPIGLSYLRAGLVARSFCRRP
ncbi:PucR family transcriptional regulator [Nocardia sp. NPDC057668]|uniref:PucR family transcriptional regulator n=1 Tax=Nocardia sp. NPDC057668 TaxID=3346202 RepID=UPI00366B07E1